MPGPGPWLSLGADVYGLRPAIELLDVHAVAESPGIHQLEEGCLVLRQLRLCFGVLRLVKRKG
jgi:hypothetical protein